MIFRKSDLAAAAATAIGALLQFEAVSGVVPGPSIAGVASSGNFILREETAVVGVLPSSTSSSLRISSDVPATVQRYAGVGGPLDGSYLVVLVSSTCDDGGAVAPIVDVGMAGTDAVVTVRVGIPEDGSASGMPFLESSSYDAAWHEPDCETSAGHGGSSTAVCATQTECDEMRKFLGIGTFHVSGEFGTKGCFSKNGIAYWGSGGSADDISRVDLPGIQERILCDYDGFERVRTPCTTRAECDEVRQRMGIAHFYEGSFPTKGCFSKLGAAYWGTDGSVEELSSGDLPGVRERIWCEDISVAATERGPSNTVSAQQLGDTNADAHVQRESATSSASSIKTFALGSIVRNAISSCAASSPAPRSRALESCAYNVEVLVGGCLYGAPAQIVVSAPKARVIDSVTETSRTEKYDGGLKKTAVLTFPDDQAQLVALTGGDYANVPPLEDQKCSDARCETRKSRCDASCDDNTGICVYTVLFDMFASEFGFYHFEECPDAGNMPDITMELGTTYRFIQRDVSNWFHPLGFAYQSDGDLAAASEDDEESEVEDDYLSYQLNGSEIELDEYEPAFTFPIEVWAAGEYHVDVTLPVDFEYARDLFYFCHIHRYLGGRIKLTRNGVMIQPAHLPVVNRLPPPPSAYDVLCGTYGLVAAPEQIGDAWPHSMSGDYRTPHPECPHTFVCEEEKTVFASCVDAINCHMFNGMSTNENYSEVALFLHQMIPHHQQAVNLAKSLLLLWDYRCDPANLGDESAQCVMENILRSIINGQNAEIQYFRGLLERNSWPEFDICDRPMPVSMELTGGNSEYDNFDISRYSGNGRDLEEKKSDENASRHERGLVEDGICRGSCSTANGRDVCVFTTKVDLFASDLGAFYFEECGIQTYPVIGIEVGKTYVFIQEDRSNFYHPLGFAYFPDGAHVGKDEVEGDALSYKVDGVEVGLDGYEPLFFHTAHEWTEYGIFTVELNFDRNYNQDLFYFCHIHHSMSGRIKLLNNGIVVQEENFPVITYIHPEPSDYDRSCGTYGLSPFQLPHPECPESFVCDKSSVFAGCLETMNCYMMAGMTSHANGLGGDVELFLHQMIPHHINAVNMAKALLKTNVLNCSDLSEDTDDCDLEGILRGILNNQNYQIQLMYGVLEGGGLPSSNDCVIGIPQSNPNTRTMPTPVPPSTLPPF